MLDRVAGFTPFTPGALELNLPTMHRDQWRVYTGPGRFKAIRCGRRWGKTDLCKTDACDAAAKGYPVGWFAPDYKITSEAYNEIAEILDPVKASSSQTAGVIRTKSGGRIDVWTLENERAGRSRKYKKVFIDEGAFGKTNVLHIWETSIKPTLLDLDGSAVVASNTNGIDPENFFWQICNEPRHGFTVYHAPSYNNPFVPNRLPGESTTEHFARRIATFRDIKKNNQPLVWQQEYLAEFVDWSGVAFFSLENLLVLGQPGAPPAIVDCVFATIDSATKTGKENDGTAVCYWALHHHGAEHKLTLLDWDIQQIEGALLETWLPNVVVVQLEHHARTCRARRGSLGAFIEDKASGMVLLQQAARRGWPAQAIESKLTSLGKSERALSASPHVYQGKVKLGRAAYDRVSTYKGTTRNHLVSQVLGFRMGDKEAHEDDLLDGFCYGVVIGLGNSEGF